MVRPLSIQALDLSTDECPAAALTANEPKDPLALSVKDLEHTLSINTTSVLAAAHEAVTDFSQLPATASKTFIYTGNRLNIAPIAPLLSLGIGKSATAHLIHSASEAYKEKGFKFYYADERKADGAPAFAIDGDAHGEVYSQLAESEGQGPWLATFVKGKGRVDF
ncbi:uncharacterized protein KY384_007839 [Bacidia gigantensis]|uniref:uncharacterized protein n=1 Tax=Bacidia gigantensis TaxID=2732470 RepID=UPI001D0454F7|nr:uncharacterized protein KY384_007839 [Bacidia gigantensis]KAG8527685.1 hypothetical protein KY384_007839 [Bacidia gigantensis]